MIKGGELTESVGKAIHYVMEVHLNAIRQELIHAAMKNSNRVETQKIFVLARNVSIIGQNTGQYLKKMAARFQR